MHRAQSSNFVFALVFAQSSSASIHGCTICRSVSNAHSKAVNSASINQSKANFHSDTDADAADAGAAA